MAVLSELTAQFKLFLGEGKINLNEDTLKIILVKSGFSFDPKKHKFLKNLKTNLTGSSDINFLSSTDTIHRDNGGFLSAGFIEGNHIKITNTTNNNDLELTIKTVTDTDITVNETGVINDESGTSATITSDDELGNGYGYTQLDKIISVESVDISNDASVVFSFSNTSWTASGGDLGATAGAIIFDDTNTDKCIIGYIDFGSDQTASDGTSLDIESCSIILG